MRIKIGREMACSGTVVSPNDYWVSLSSDSSEIKLSAAGRDIRLKAVRRKAKGQGKTTQVSYYPSGGKNWSIVVMSPKYGEWIAVLEAL